MRNAADLQHLAAAHLWGHFTPLSPGGRDARRPGDRSGGRADDEIEIIERGEGCYVWDEHGKRYLDALSTLFCVNAGHGRAAIAEAGARQARELAYATTWGPAHPPAIELAERIAGLAPGDLNRVFFTSGGSESVESALKLTRAYHRLRGEPTRTK